MGNTSVIGLALAVAVFGVIANHARDMYRDKKYQEMAGTLFWAVVPIAIFSAFWIANENPSIMARNIILGMIGAVLGTCALIWIGYLVGGPGTGVQTLTPQPTFSAEVRSGVIYTEKGPLSLFMAAYQSSHGWTVSPLRFLLYLQVTNRQDHPSKVNSYSMFFGNSSDGPWKPMKSIPLHTIKIFALGITQPSSGGTLYVPRGTYRLGTQMQSSDLEHAAEMKAEPVLSDKLGETTLAYQAVEGWAAFDVVTSDDNIPLGPHLFFKIVIRDSVNTTATNVGQAPLPSEGETDTAAPLLQRMGPIVDLRPAFVKFYHDP
jgi:hypothetical protein